MNYLTTHAIREGVVGVGIKIATVQGTASTLTDYLRCAFGETVSVRQK